MIKRLFILSSFLLYISCAEESNPNDDITKFTRIYDNNNFASAIYPIDMVQTPEGEYLLLAGRRIGLQDDLPTFSGIYLLKADKFGNFVQELEVGDTLVNPIGRFTAAGGKYYFFCMSANNTGVLLADVDAGLTTLNTTEVDGLTYPLAASFVNNRFLLLSYSNDDLESVISAVSTAGAVQDTKGYSIGIGEGVEEPIMNHILRTGKQYPFDVGQITGGAYYFNGFYNYTFSLVFTDMQADDPSGVVQGQQDDGGFSALSPISGSTVAAARFNFGDNFLLPRVNLNTTGNSPAVDLGGYTLPELVDDAPVKILRMPIKGKNMIVFASNTKSKQIGLFFYDEATGEFISSRYLGFSNPFEIANLMITSEGGLSVCGTTYLAGRFPRICIFKLSEEDLAENAD